MRTKIDRRMPEGEPHPYLKGRFPSERSFRVVLSMAAM